jgi:hypothetical protein
MLKRAITTTGKLIYKGMKILAGCCCGPPPPDCGCCVNPGTEDAECVDTELPGEAGETYCTETLGGAPMMGTWFDRTYRCVPCDYEAPGAGTVQPVCPQPPGTCADACEDLETAPATVLFAVDGPFNETPDCVDCEQINPPNTCFAEECELLRSMLESALTTGVILDQEITTCGFPPEDYPCFDCEWNGSLTYETCRPASCIFTGGEDPCQFICFVTVQVTVGFNTCGMWFVANMITDCGPSNIVSGCASPNQFAEPDFDFSIQGGSGFGDPGPCSPANCLEGATDDVSVFNDDAGFLDGAPDVFIG